MKVSIGIAFLLLHQSRGEVNTVPLPTNLQCPSSQVFDFTGLVCTDCDSTKSSGLQPDVTSAHTCKCPPSLLQNNVECSIESMWQGTCNTASCSSECSLLSQVSSLDQQTCILCQGNSSHYESSEYDIDFKECTCKNPAKGPATGKPVVTRKLVEIYDNITGLPSRNDCMRCPDGTAVISKELYNNGQFYSTAGATYIADPHSCSYCPDAHMFFDTDYNCVCPDGFVLTGEASVGKQSCIYHYPSVSGGSKVGFQDTISIGSESRGAYDFTLDSIVFSHYYLKAASNCEYYKGTFEDLQSCQTLSNLCVMSMYDEAAPACKQLQIISQRRQGTYHKQEDWIYSLPWLYYDNEPTDDRGLQMKMAFHPEAYHTNSLIFKLFKYTLNGTFVGVESLNSQLEFCFDSMSRDGSQPQWLTFGNGFRNEYSCSIDSLFNKDMYFYDLYIVDDSSESCMGASEASECLYPVPVLVRNFVEDNSRPNINQQTLDEFNDRYTRRFFFVDNQSGITASGLEAIRYAKTIVLQMLIQTEQPNKMYPPKLIIEYATSTSASWSSNGKEGEPTDSLVFKAEYTMQTANFWATIQIMSGFVIACGVCVFGVRLNNWQSRQRAVGNDLSSIGSMTGFHFMIHANMIAFHTLVLLGFPFAFMICCYWFVFFKLQSEVFLLLPSDNEFYHSSNEYFFFELAFRSLFWCQTAFLSYTIIQQCRSDVIFIDWERPIRKGGGGVSMWRTVLIANEWNRMQTRRKNSVEFSLILVGFFMYGLDQYNNASPQPNFDNAHHGHTNVALQFANNVMFWGMASLSQYVWRFLLYERYITEPPSTKFIDLCTVCNISCFVLMDHCKSYYLHCRSPYQSAECAMDELLEQLTKEANGFAIDRGLDGASKGCQVFDLFTSSMFRRQISKIYFYVWPGRSPFFKNDQESPNKNERIPLARAEITSFLQTFIEQQNRLSYVIREPLLVEQVFGLTPADFRTQSDAKCILQPEETRWNHDYGYLSATFLGIELDLLIHDILTYNAADMAFNNSAISMFVTYMMHLLRTSVRSWFGRKNLSMKSFIDEKFLYT